MPVLARSASESGYEAVDERSTVTLRLRLRVWKFSPPAAKLNGMSGS